MPHRYLITLSRDGRGCEETRRSVERDDDAHAIDSAKRLLSLHRNAYPAPWRYYNGWIVARPDFATGVRIIATGGVDNGQSTEAGQTGVETLPPSAAGA